MTHTTVRLGDYTIPLIGVKQTATEEECDLCHDIFHLSQIELAETQFLCGRCRREETKEQHGTVRLH